MALLSRNMRGLYVYEFCKHRHLKCLALLGCYFNRTNRHIAAASVLIGMFARFKTIHSLTKKY
jgi:hypothetical protein